MFSLLQFIYIGFYTLSRVDERDRLLKKKKKTGTATKRVPATSGAKPSPRNRLSPMSFGAELIRRDSVQAGGRK